MIPAIGDPSISDRVTAGSPTSTTHISPLRPGRRAQRAWLPPLPHTRSRFRTASASAHSARTPIGLTTSLPSSACATASTLALTPNRPPLARTSTVPPSLFTSATSNPVGSALLMSASLITPSRAQRAPMLFEPRIRQPQPSHFHAFHVRIQPFRALRFLQQRHRLRRAQPQAPRLHPHFVRLPPRQLHRRPRLHAHALHGPVLLDFLAHHSRRDPRPQQLRQHHHQPRSPPPPRPRPRPPSCASPLLTRPASHFSPPSRCARRSHARSRSHAASLALSPGLGRVAQLARAPRLHRGGRPFESGRAHPRHPPMTDSAASDPTPFASP